MDQRVKCKENRPDPSYFSDPKGESSALFTFCLYSDKISKIKFFSYLGVAMGFGSYLKENEQKAVKSLHEALSKKFSLVDFRLFGSKARGESDDESDVDVMIEVAELDPEIENQIDKMIFEINLAHDSFISAIIFSRKDLEEGPLSESPIYKIIQKEGVQV